MTLPGPDRPPFPHPALNPRKVSLVTLWFRHAEPAQNAFLASSETRISAKILHLPGISSVPVEVVANHSNRTDSLAAPAFEIVMQP